MKLPLVIILAWSVFLFLTSLTVVGGFDFYAGNFYWFTVPFLAASGMCSAIAIVGLCWRGRRRVLFWLAAPWHALLILPFAFAMVLWPGGDDGPGMAWGLFVGGGSIVAFVLSGALMLGSWLPGRRKMNAQPSGTANRS